MEQTTTSLWIGTAPSPSFGPLREGQHVDVAIIGAGITGLTAAMLLKQRGKRVAVIEKERIVSGETGNTTAHITEAIDARYHFVARTFSKDAARVVAQASRASIEQIASFVQQYNIECAFKRLPGYLYTERRGDVAELKKEAIAAAEAGVAAKFTESVPLPFATRGGVMFENQAQFHPRRYLFGLVPHIQGDGSFIFDNTHVTDIKEGEPCVVETSHGTITADLVFEATNVPIAGFISLNLKDAAYRTYALACPWEGENPDGLFWDTDEPYHYTRWQETDQGKFLIVGGADHKVGQEKDTESCFADLEKYTAEKFGKRTTAFRWSGQVIDPVDGLPYIGQAGKMFVSTGYAGQGMTFGTVGGMIVADLITGRENPWADLFNANRIKARGAIKDFVTENVDFPKHIIKDRILRLDVETKRTVDVKPGEGKIASIAGQKVALFRAENGTLQAVSPICTHMRCDVHFNNAEKTWDCPCHGSRFKTDGAVLNGPAKEPLEKLEVEE
jgi:glycine/D-amino acid oxidase-like deaminating enzyme/nitrite reductase/ring-hydroxylating ferredoxin subunit